MCVCYGWTGCRFPSRCWAVAPAPLLARPLQDRFWNALGEYNRAGATKYTYIEKKKLKIFQPHIFCMRQSQRARAERSRSWTSYILYEAR